MSANIDKNAIFLNLCARMRGRLVCECFHLCVQFIHSLGTAYTKQKSQLRYCYFTSWNNEYWSICVYCEITLQCILIRQNVPTEN